MDLYIYNPAIEQQGVIDSYSSLRWRRRFFEPGEFELHCPATEENLSLLVEGNIIHRLDRTEAGIIEGKAVNDTDNGDEITVTGRFGSSILEQRSITPTINFSGPVEVAMRKAVSDNAVTARPISLLSLGALNGFTETTSFQATWKTVLDVLTTLSKSSNIGFRVRFDVPNQAWIFETYKGLDKSVTQAGRPYVAFNNELRNITGPVYTLNNQSYKNYAIVGGEGEGTARIVVTVDQTNGEPLRELWVDAKDLQKGDLSDTDYQTQLIQRGVDALVQAAKAESFEAAAVNTENFEYLTDWDLGDIVTFEKWGILLNRRITEVEEVDENGVFTVTPVCGEPLSETISSSDSGGYFEATSGAAGEAGPMGPQGVKGDKGDTGLTGPAGTTDYNNLQNKPTSLPANGGISDYSNQLTSYVFTRGNTSPIWAKVATVSIPYSMWFEYHAIAFVKGRHNSNYSQNGILAIDAVGNGTNGAVASSTAKFINASAGLDLSNFYIEKLNATSATAGYVNLWARISTNPYAAWDIRVLTNSGWAFASSTTSASALPTSGYTGAAATIENQASKLVTARTINGVSFDGRANITIADSTKAPLDSPNLSGIPTAPTPTNGTNTTQIATTAFVQSSLVASGSGLPLSGGTLTGNLNVQLASGDKIASLVPEVNGQLLDFGTNFTQSGNRRTAENGALFRIDVRDGYPVFNVIWQGANATETVPFSVTRDGTVSAAIFNGKATTPDAGANDDQIATAKFVQNVVKAIGAVKASTLVAATLTAAGWTGTTAPYSQTISVTGVTTTSVNEILPGASITADQLAALQAANLQDGSQVAGSITLKAYGDKPTINLPIRVVVRGDM